MDLFTEAWTADERGVFREGFGCTPGGKFLQEHAWDFGFVMPYPLHPDDRHPNQKCVARWDIPTNINPKTGYRFEHWHVRFIGKDSALRFRAALEKSGLDSPDEITVEQWLRTEKGITGADSELPVCDGCNCGACATLAEPSKNACDKLAGALHLDAHGKPLKSHGTPMIKNVAPGGRAKTWNGAIVEVKLDVPEQLLTQPPIVGLGSAGYAMGVTFEKLAPYPNTKARAFPPLAHAWVVAVEPVPNDTGTPWPWRAAITLPITGQIYDRANVLLPARAGMVTINVPIPAVPKVRIVLLEGGIPKGDEKTLDLH